MGEGEMNERSNRIGKAHNPIKKPDQYSKQNDFDIDNIFEDVAINEKIKMGSQDPVIENLYERNMQRTSQTSFGQDVQKIEKFESQFEQMLLDTQYREASGNVKLPKNILTAESDV